MSRPTRSTLGLATPAMDDDTTEPFGFPAVGRKKLAAAFDGGRQNSDGGVTLLAAVFTELMTTVRG